MIQVIHINLLHLDVRLTKIILSHYKNRKPN